MNKQQLTNICDWFVDNKFSIHFGEDKSRSILFSTKNRKRKIGTLNIQYSDVKIKQYSKVTCLGCQLGESLSGEAMALNVIYKIDSRLKFLYRKNIYLTPYLKRLVFGESVSLVKLLSIVLLLPVSRQTLVSL